MTETNQKPYSEPPWVTSDNKLKQIFYRANIEDKLGLKTRSLLRTYSHIADDVQLEHVEKIRDQAWRLRPYPCIGLGAYLVPQLCQLPVYQETLDRLMQGRSLVDVGCFLGHDLRHLANDGAPTENLYGVDIANFWDLGLEMFRDADRFKAHFLETDLMNSGKSLAQLKGKCAVVSIFQVLHQWDWDGQVQAAKALVELASPDAMVVGNQIGHPEAGEVVNPSLPKPCWRHNEASFAPSGSRSGSLPTRAGLVGHG